MFPVQSRIDFKLFAGYKTNHEKAIQSPRNVSGKRRDSPFPTIVGQLLSPRAKIQRAPVVAPTTSAEVINESNKPGAKKSKEYVYLFFIEWRLPVVFE